jgi:hypothetical protein
MSRWQLDISPLNVDLCHELAPRVSEGDRIDLLAHGYEPLGALLDGVDAEGQAWGVRVDGVAVGAFGWTSEGSIWSLWSNLTMTQKVALLRLSPAFISAMVKDSGLRLSNLVWEGNEVTRKWLEATGCFEFFIDMPQVWDNKNYIPFAVRSDLTERFPDYV